MRIDVYLTQNNFFSSRTRAQAAIKAKKVLIDGKTARCGDDVSDGADIKVLDIENYVSMGMFKLRKAFEDFSITAEGKVAVDIGASTGGFTEELLLRGASRVYAVDVGENQLSSKLRECERVVVMDRTNARALTSDSFNDRINLVVIDVSFISLKYIIPVAKDILQFGGEVVALIKPQFEVGAQHLNKHGIVRDSVATKLAIDDLKRLSEGLGFNVLGISMAPERERKNLEYLMYLKI